MVLALVMLSVGFLAGQSPSAEAITAQPVPFQKELDFAIVGGDSNGVPGTGSASFVVPAATGRKLTIEYVSISGSTGSGQEAFEFTTSVNGVVAHYYMPAAAYAGAPPVNTVLPSQILGFITTEKLLVYADPGTTVTVVGYQPNLIASVASATFSGQQ
jgi:hypothetical protein